MPTLIKLLEIELSSTLTKRYAISGWPVTYDSNVYDNDGTFVGLGDLKFSLELENNPFEVTLHLSDQDVLDSINTYSYRFRDATLIVGEWNGTMIDQSTIVVKKGFIDTHSDPSADFTVDFTISSYLELASKQRGDIAASSAHAIKLKDGVFGDDNKTTVDTIFDKANNDWNYITLGRTRAGSTTTQIGGARPCSKDDHWFNNDPVYQTTQIPESAGVRITNNGEAFHTPVAYGRTKLNYQLVNAWNPTPAAVAIAYPTITWDEEDFDELVEDDTKYITMVFAVCHGPIEKLEVYNATNDDILILLDNADTSDTGSIRRTSSSTTSLAVLDVVNNGENNVALAKSVTASAGAYTTDDRGIGYTLVHVTAIASGFWESGIPDLTFVADSTHIRPLTSAGVSPTRSGVNGSGEVMYDYLSSRQYGLGLADEYLDPASFYDFQANSLDIYPDNLRGSVTGSGSFLKFLERMQQSCAARIYEESGVVKLWYGDILDNSDIQKEFIDNGLSNTNCIITQQNPRSRSVFNEVTGKYFAIFDASDQPPDNIQKTVVISNTDYLTEDNGIKSTTSFDMDFLTLDADGDGFVNPADEQQINEIVNLVLQKSRLFQEVEITTSYDEASGLKLGDLIRCEVSRYGWEVADRRLFFIREIIYTADGNVSIIGQRHSNTVYGGVDSFTNIDVENVFPVRLDGLNSLDSYLTTGPQGPQGRFFLQIYIRSETTPTTPTGGTYVNSTNTLTPPTGWFDVIGDVPAGDGNIYFSQATYNPADDPDSITPSWSVAAQVGTTGAAGADAVTINATSNDYSVIYDSDGANPSPTTVTLTGTAQNVINGFFRFTGGGSDFPDETTFTDGDTALTATRTFTLPTTITESDTRSFNVAVADGDQNELAFDTFTINLIQTAANGSAGANGEDAFTVIMQNEATVLPSNSAGVVSSYDGSENEIEVYRGGTQLTYSGAAGDPSSSQFKISFIDTNITAGAITLSGNNAAIAQASAFTNSADFATINLTIQVRNQADDANISFVKIQNFTKSKEGGTGTRGSGDWHYRVGTTLEGTYTDAELSAFLAATVPGTEGDAPVQGDRLWIFASPSEADQSVTEQQVYIWDGANWINQAAAIDGNLLVSGTVTADNVVADVSIRSPVITGGIIRGGVISGAVIQAGLLISEVSAFPINQQINVQEDPPLVFLDGDGNAVGAPFAFTQSDNSEPYRIQQSEIGIALGQSFTDLTIPANRRILNVNQGIIPLLDDVNNTNGRRNWGAWAPYAIRSILPDRTSNHNKNETRGVRWPSLTINVMNGNGTLADSISVSTSVVQDNDPFMGSQFFDTDTFVGTVFFDGSFTYSADCGNSYGGYCTNWNSIHERNGVETRFSGYIRLVDEQYVSVDSSWVGDYHGDTGLYRMFSYSVAVPSVTDNRFYPLDENQRNIDVTAPVIDPPSLPPVVYANQSLSVVNGLGDSEGDVSLTPVSLDPPELIDGDVTDMINIPASAITGSLGEVQLENGNIFIEDITTFPPSVADRISQTTDAISGSGIYLSGSEVTNTFAIGEFDTAALPPAWVSGSDYVVDDFVLYNSIVYIVLADITNSTDNPEDDTDNFASYQVADPSFLYFTESTGLVVGGTVTAGAVRGGDLVSSDVPTGTESGAFINLDNGTFLFGNAQEYFRYDGTNIIIAGVPVDGQLIETASITGDKIAINTVIARTIRSDNYVAPTLPENPPNQGYSLEHIEGIGFFEEIRADLTGTVTAPSQTPSQGTFTYSTSAITYEYLNISSGDSYDDFFATDEDGVIRTYKGVLSSPIYTLVLPDNIEDNYNTPASSNINGASRIEAGAAYEVYTNLSVNNITTPGDVIVGGVWFGYDADNNRIGELNITNSDFTDPFVGNGILLPQGIGTLREVGLGDAVDTADSIQTFNAGLALAAGSVELGAEIPVSAKLHMIAVHSRSTTDSTPSVRPGESFDFSLTAGIRANSSIEFEVKSNDGTSQTTTITQNQP